jgi:drug/metabolite transporter (DMT)-like permease
MVQTEPFQRNVVKGFTLALAGAALQSLNYVTAKYGLEGFHYVTFSLVWTASAAFYALMIVLATGRGRELALPRPALLCVVLMGLATGVGMLSGWAALDRLDPSFTAFLWRFTPVLAILGGALMLRERLSAGEIVASAVMVLGACVSTIGRWNIVGVGVLLALLSSCCVAAQMLLAKAKVTEVHPDVLTFYRVGIGALAIVVYAAVYAVPSGQVSFAVAKPYWIVTVVGAFLGPCLSYNLTFRSYSHWELARTSMVRTSQPLFVVPLAYVFLGKLPAGREWAGGLVILAAAVWMAWMQLRGSGQGAGAPGAQ